MSPACTTYCQHPPIAALHLLPCCCRPKRPDPSSECMHHNLRSPLVSLSHTPFQRRSITQQQPTRAPSHQEQRLWLCNGRLPASGRPAATALRPMHPTAHTEHHLVYKKTTGSKPNPSSTARPRWLAALAARTGARRQPARPRHVRHATPCVVAHSPFFFYMYSRGSHTKPLRADAAAVKGEAR